MRVLVVSNMRPDEAHPERGSFVRDQVEALRGLPDLDVELANLDVELAELGQGARGLLAGARELRTRYAAQRFDVVHAHFGLSAWPALTVRARARGLTVHGTDVSHPRTRALTWAVLPRIDLLCAVSEQLVARLPGARARARAAVVPCGVNLRRFGPIPRERAREELGLEPRRRYVLFAADPARPEKRLDRAVQLARAAEVELLTLGGVAPERVALYVNAADAVLVPSEREGFGLAALEALACGVPVLATPVGVHEQALAGVRGALCEPFDLGRWSAHLAQVLRQSDPRVEGRQAVERFSTTRMAERLARAWRSLVARPG